MPTASISYAGSPYCATGTANVTRVGQSGGSYSASPSGLSISASTGQINLTASAPGTYTVTYSCSNSNCSSSTTTTVTVNAVPTASISYSAAAFCATGTANVTITGNGVTSGTFSASSNNIVLNAATGAIDLGASAPGTYTITYTYSNGTCTGKANVTVKINAVPTATIAYNGSPYCATGTTNVNRSGQSGGAYTALPAGLVINASTGQINLAASQPNTYTVTYSFSNGSCSNTATATVVVKAVPTASISYPSTPFCATGTAAVNLVGQSGGSFSASPNGLSINNATGAINLGSSAPGNYTITYTVTNGGCSVSATTTIRVNAQPTASISYAGSPYCATGTANVTRTGQTGGSYSATPGGLSINASTGQINLAASQPNTYTVTYSFSNGSCSGTTTTTVVVTALPTASIAYPGTPFCATGTASVVQGGQTGGTYTASPNGLAINSTTGQINLTNSAPGTYTVSYSFSNGNCSGTTTTSVKVNAVPSASIADASAYKYGVLANVVYSGWAPASSLAYTAKGNGGSGSYSYAWTKNSTLIGSSASLQVTSSGTYAVKITDANGCFATSSKVVAAINVSCNGSNVSLCQNGQTGCYSSNLVDSKLKQGAMLGACGSNPAARISTSTIVNTQVDRPEETTVFDLKASPNPTTSYFNLKVESDQMKEPMTLRVIDVSGKPVEIRKNLVSGQTLQIGHEYRPGVYFAELVQGNRRKVVRLMKLPD